MPSTVNTPIPGASPSTPRRLLRITVLRGGPSAEREVSLASGAAVAAALRRRGHTVFEADIDADHLEALDQPADVVFPVLHGRFGEDGALQQILESRGLRFVGSGAKASAAAMNKLAAKRLAASAGINTPVFQVVSPEESEAASPALPLPVIVKPIAEGSSVATTVVRQAGDFLAAVRRVTENFGPALVEQFIVGDELTVGILFDRAMPPICIRPRSGFYDYHAKYRATDTEYLFDAGHPPAVLAEAQRLSLRVFECLGCRHLGRVDWMVQADGTLWFLEVNTLPGFTDHSLLPKAAAHVGIGFDELCERLALAAAEDRA